MQTINEVQEFVLKGYVAGASRVSPKQALWL